MPSYAMPLDATLCYAVLHYDMRDSTVPYYSMSYSTIAYCDLIYTVLFRYPYSLILVSLVLVLALVLAPVLILTLIPVLILILILCCAILFYTYSTLLYSTMPCYAMPCHAMAYCTTLGKTDSFYLQIGEGSRSSWHTGRTNPTY